MDDHSAEKKTAREEDPGPEQASGGEPAESPVKPGKEVAGEPEAEVDEPEQGAVGVGEAPHETTGFVGRIDEPVEVEPEEGLEDRAEGEE